LRNCCFGGSYVFVGCFLCSTGRLLGWRLAFLARSTTCEVWSHIVSVFVSLDDWSTFWGD
jgi:hypothetical protein